MVLSISELKAAEESGSLVWLLFQVSPYSAILYGGPITYLGMSSAEEEAFEIKAERPDGGEFRGHIVRSPIYGSEDEAVSEAKELGWKLLNEELSERNLMTRS